MSQRNLLNGIIILTVLVSVILFMAPGDVVLQEAVYPLSVKLIEGEGFGEFYRRAEAVTEVANGLDTPFNCTVLAEIFQDELVGSNKTRATIYPGRNTVSVPILLPNGENRVVMSVSCD